MIVASLARRSFPGARLHLFGPAPSRWKADGHFMRIRLAARVSDHRPRVGRLESGWCAPPHAPISPTRNEGPTTVNDRRMSLACPAFSVVHGIHVQRPHLFEPLRGRA